MAAAFPYVAAIISAAASVSQSNATARQEKYAARVADENAKRAEESAQEMRRVGVEAEAAKRLEIRRALGRSSAAMAEAGIGGAAYGSQGQLLKQSAALGEFDAQVTRYQNQTGARDMDLEKLNQQSASVAARRRARGAKSSAFLNAASSAMSGYASYASRG